MRIGTSLRELLRGKTFTELETLRPCTTSSTTVNNILPNWRPSSESAALSNIFDPFRRLWNILIITSASPVSSFMIDLVERSTNPKVWSKFAVGDKQSYSSLLCIQHTSLPPPPPLSACQTFSAQLDKVKSLDALDGGRLHHFQTTHSLHSDDGQTKFLGKVLKTKTFCRSLAWARHLLEM